MMRFGADLEWIDSQQVRMVTLLGQWAGINTGSYNVSGLAAFEAAIAPVLGEMTAGWETIALDSQKLVNEKGMLVQQGLGRALAFRPVGFERRVGGPRVLLGIHYDTVFGVDDAFQTATHVGDGTLRGPGACDAKGGLLVMLFALMALERSAWRGKLRWEVLVTPDEELGSPSSTALWAAAARRNDVGLLFEPALPDGALVSARKGSANYTLVVRGRAAHAGRDFAIGRNAIHTLAGLMMRLSSMQQDFPGVQVNVGVVRGGEAVNVVPDLAFCRFNVRVENAAQQAAVEKTLHEIAAVMLDGISVQLHPGAHCGPKPLTAATERLLGELKQCAEAISIPLTWRATGGVCDGNRVAAEGIPVVDSLGVRGGGLHTDQEFVVLESLTERAKLVALFLMRLAAGDFMPDGK